MPRIGVMTSQKQVFFFLFVFFLNVFLTHANSEEIDSHWGSRETENAQCDEQAMPLAKLCPLLDKSEMSAVSLLL